MFSMQLKLSHNDDDPIRSAGDLIGCTPDRRRNFALGPCIDFSKRQFNIGELRRTVMINIVKRAFDRGIAITERFLNNTIAFVTSNRTLPALEGVALKMEKVSEPDSCQDA
ncbi:hypothetical protein VTN77DRAFT_5468 [Rasamsonia byssochlamydoides]|uniref:uncharacterized protein n=1 Tax=Rasamsonia byssochlamydoides TaxID=89139 RepID=UPI0037446480